MFVFLAIAGASNLHPVVPPAEGQATLPGGGAGDEWMAAVRQAYIAAVSDAGAIGPGLELVAGLRVTKDGDDGADIVLTAYTGAFITLRAKHAFWPPTRLRHLRDGLAILDAAVGRAPHDPEVRYLRLMSCYHLPRMLGRGWSVREDFSVLARLLPEIAHGYPADLYVSIAEFVLENGDPPAADRRRLEASLESLSDD